MAQRAAPLRVIVPAPMAAFMQTPRPASRKKVAGAMGGLFDQQLSPYMPNVPTLSTLVKSPLQFIVADVKTRKIGMFLLLSTAFMVVEFVYGFHSNSLGLISDACHMLFDCAALAIGLYASYISKLQANARFNYGYGRFEVISGYMNAVFLILVASLIVLESLERILDPPEISTESLLLVSIGGFLVNVVGLIFFHEAHHHHHGGTCAHSHAHKEKSSPGQTHLHAKGADHKIVEVEEHHHCNEDHHGHTLQHDGGQRENFRNHIGHAHGPDGYSVQSHGTTGQHGYVDQSHVHSNQEQGTGCTHGHSGHSHGHANHGQNLHHGHLDMNHSHSSDHDHAHGHGHGRGHSHDHEIAHDHTDHNMQGIFLHILADTLGSVGVVVSTLLIKYKGWYFTDPACSIFISALIIASVIPLVRSSAEMLLQRMPRATESRIQHFMKQVEAIDGVWSCQALHIWNFTNAEIMGSLHLLATRGTDKERLRTAVAHVLKKAGITDITLQVETV